MSRTDEVLRGVADACRQAPARKRAEAVIEYGKQVSGMIMANSTPYHG